jgi:hypothetical protein
MADKKISALDPATTPLVGTEALAVVQGGATKKVSVADLTAGRAIATAGGSFTDNFTQSIAGKGFNFSANANAPGMTSELLNWYEEGAFTPTIISSVGTTTLTSSVASYTRNGNIVMLQIQVTINTDASVGTADFTIGSFPFTGNARAARGFVVTSNWTSGDINDGYIQMAGSATSMVWSGRSINASSRTGNTLTFQVIYRT